MSDVPRNIPVAFSRRSRGLLLFAAVAVIAAAAWLWRAQFFSPAPIRIGVLHSLSGPTANAERPLVDALRLAAEEINAAGGLLGRPLELVVADVRSDPRLAAQEAERLIVRENVQVLFGGWTSPVRKAVKAVVEERRHLLFYPAPYEGLEQSPNLIYTGGVPNQQLIPAVRWALGQGHRRFYLLGSGLLFPRVASVIIKDLLAAQGAELAGERYLTLGVTGMDDVVADLARLKPDMVLNLVSGDGNALLFRALAGAGLTAGRLPVLSFRIGEGDLTPADRPLLAGHYAVGSYFQSIATPENRDFVARFRARYGAARLVGDATEASYVGLRLWALAARESGTPAPASVQRAILRQSFLAPEGVVSVGATTRHLWKTVRIGQARRDGQFDVVWESSRPVRPVPFPTYRLHTEWVRLLQTLEGDPR
jgi:urea transport system substrate-binding protein